MEPVDPDIPQCLIGVDDDGQLHILIPIGDEAIKLPSSLEAVVVQIIDFNGNHLDVYAKGHYEMLFTPMANQIFIGIVKQGRKAIDAVVQTIEEFKGALKPIKPDLSLVEQIGLFGELWVLQNVLIPIIGSRACFLWSGPNSERHDFIGEAVHIEVKSTTRSEDRHEISRIDQLRAPVGKKLLFASIQLERSEGGEKTLANLIDEITTSLGMDGSAIDTFESRLSNIGWHDGLRQSNSLRRFSLRNALFFDVEDSFPRLPDDYIPPRGIVAIKYTIDISSRSVIDRDEIDILVKSM